MHLFSMYSICKEEDLFFIKMKNDRNLRCFKERIESRSLFWLIFIELIEAYVGQYALERGYLSSWSKAYNSHIFNTVKLIKLKT